MLTVLQYSSASVLLSCDTASLRQRKLLRSKMIPSNKLKQYTQRGAIVIALCTMLPLSFTGCQNAIESGPLIYDQAYWQGMQERLQQISSVQLRGNVSVSYKSDNFSTNFIYSSDAPNNYQLHLINSFGASIADINVTPEKSTLLADQREFTAATPQELFTQALNMPLPLNDFTSIILGLALPSSTFTPQGILHTTTLPDFNITYNDYLSLTDSQISLPSEIEVTGPDLHLLVKTRAVQKLQLKEQEPAVEQ